MDSNRLNIGVNKTIAPHKTPQWKWRGVTLQCHEPSYYSQLRNPTRSHVKVFLKPCKLQAAPSITKSSYYEPLIWQGLHQIYFEHTFLGFHLVVILFISSSVTILKYRTKSSFVGESSIARVAHASQWRRCWFYFAFFVSAHLSITDWAEPPKWDGTLGIISTVLLTLRSWWIQPLQWWEHWLSRDVIKCSTHRLPTDWRKPATNMWT